MSDPSPAPRVLLPLVGLVLLFLALYGRAAGFSYVWDDVATLRDNPAFDRPLSEGVRITQHGHIDPNLTRLRGVAPSHESYRPLLFLTFATEVALAGRSASVMHATNVVLGVLAILLAFSVASELLRDRRAGLLVAAVFALHPLQVESVCYVSARADVLAGLLALASVALALRNVPALVPALVFLASLYAKEAHIGLPLLLLAGVWLLDRRTLLRPALAMLAAIPVYAGLRALILAGSAPASVGQVGSVVQGALAFPGLVLRYAALFVVPYPLSVVRPLRDGWAIAGWVVFVAIAAAVVWALRTRRLCGDRALAAFALGWACVTVGPSAIVARIMGVVADRYAYLPVFGFALMVVALARLVPSASSRVLAAGALAWALACVAITAVQIGAWRDERALYTRAVAAEPGSSAAHYGLGLVHAQAGHWSEAIVAFERALVLDPTNSRGRNNLGVAYMNVGRLDEAERTLRAAIVGYELVNFRAWYNLARVQRARGQRGLACDSLRRALSINPGYTPALEDARFMCGES